MLNGYKTYTGLVIVILGWLGIGSLFTEGEITNLVDSAIQLFGVIMAWYGRYKATN